MQSGHVMSWIEERGIERERGREKKEESQKVVARSTR